MASRIRRFLGILEGRHSLAVYLLQNKVIGVQAYFMSRTLHSRSERYSMKDGKITLGGTTMQQFSKRVANTHWRISFSDGDVQSDQMLETNGLTTPRGLRG
jgi:hypothetical protein